MAGDRGGGALPGEFPVEDFVGGRLGLCSPPFRRTVGVWRSGVDGRSELESTVRIHPRRNAYAALGVFQR